MATISDLLNKLNEKFDIISLEDKGTTAGGKVKEYDMWYNQEGVIYYKRIHIFVDDDGNAFWFGENPLGGTPQSSIIDEIKNKIKEIENLVDYSIDKLDEEEKKAILTVFIDDGTTLITKKAILTKDENNEWNIEIRNV